MADTQSKHLAVSRPGVWGHRGSYRATEATSVTAMADIFCRGQSKTHGGIVGVGPEFSGTFESTNRTTAALEFLQKSAESQCASVSVMGAV